MHCHIGSRPRSVISPHPIHACARGCLSVVFFLLSFFFLSKFLFHLFLILSMVLDENSMNDPLCNSAIGSMVSLDYVTPDTGYEPKDMELADTNELNLAASSDICFQDFLEDTVSFPNPDIDDDELAKLLAIVVGGNPFWKRATTIIFLVVSET